MERAKSVPNLPVIHTTVEGGGQLTRGSGLPLYATLLSFQNLIYPLDSLWILSGLGNNYGLKAQVTQKAAVLHYNGAMKPWLYLGIPMYKDYWRKYLNRDDQNCSDCNVNP